MVNSKPNSNQNSQQNSPHSSRPTTPTGDDIKKTVAELENELVGYKQQFANIKTIMQNLMDEIDQKEQEINALKGGQSTSNKEIKEAIERAKKEGSELKAEMVEMDKV